MLDLGRSAPESVPLPEINREFVFFDLMGRLCKKASDGAVSVLEASGSGGQGLQGIQGPKGDPGIQGLPGVQGEAGAQGLPGRPGLDGQNGQNGLKGDVGDAGLPGADGQQGPIGPMGPLGPIGPQGLPGIGALARSSVVQNTTPQTAVGGVTLITIALPDVQAQGGASVSVKAVLSATVGTATSGRASMRILIGGVLVATLASAALGAVGATVPVYLSGDIMVSGVAGAFSVDGYVEVVYGASVVRSMLTKQTVATVSIAVESAIVTASAGFGLTHRASSLVAG